MALQDTEPGWVATDHVTFDQGALSPLGWPYCCLCFRPLNTADCWRDGQGVAWDVCRPCKAAEIAANPKASQPTG